MSKAGGLWLAGLAWGRLVWSAEGEDAVVQQVRLAVMTAKKSPA